ncbi:MAG TPA: hypothetical protein VFJ29_00685, partial [Candidatus Kapabacteria bacterium]|nr:hypothetical protein [Candidatus Kapabacteria bacterium]
MRLTQKLLIAFSALFMYSLAYSQGLNNEQYPIDSSDITNVFTMLGVQVFKFPVKPFSKPCYINIITETYDDTTLTATDDMLKDSKRIEEKYHIKNTMPILDSSTQWIRIYGDEKEPTECDIVVEIAAMKQTSPYVIDTNK